MALQCLLLSLSLLSPLLTPTISHVVARDLGTAQRPTTWASNDFYPSKNPIFWMQTRYAFLQREPIPKGTNLESD